MRPNGGRHQAPGMLRALMACVAPVVARSTTTGMCRGFGARFEERLLALPLGAAPPDRLPLVYDGFCDTALRGWASRGTALLRGGLMRVRGQFESEAEKWVEGAFSATTVAAAATATAGPQLLQNGSGASASNGSNGVAAAGLFNGARSCLGRLYGLLLERLDARPPSFVRLPPEDGAWNRIVLLSGGDRNAALSERLVGNHEEFARRHGYAYWWHRGSLVNRLGWRPYWHKVAHLLASIERFPSALASVWIDDDVVFTNHAGSDMLQLALRRSNASVLVTRDPAASFGIHVNTGIVAVRHDAHGRSVLTELWRRATAVRADGVQLATGSQRDCLHEQQALQEMLQDDDAPHWRQRVAVLVQRAAEPSPSPSAAARGGSVEHRERRGGRAGLFNLNTFLRWSHADVQRAEMMRFDADDRDSAWVEGDFAGHCSGLSPLRRVLCVAVLLEAVVR